MKFKLKYCLTISLALLFLFALTTANSFAGSDMERLEEVWSTDYFVEERWTPQSLHHLFEEAGFHITQDEAAHIIELETAGDIRASHDYTMNILGISVLSGVIGGSGGGDEAAAYTSPAGVTSRLVMQNLVIPAAKTRAAKKKEDAQKALNMPRTFGAALSWEDVDFDNSGENGDLYGATIGMAWDNENISYGFMLPYDYLDFDSFDAHRIGLLGFGQYNLELSDSLSTSFTGHLNYTYTDLDLDNGGSDDVNMFGGGLSAAITLDKDLYILSTGVTYLYNTDDTDFDNDEQHLIKWGVNAGVRNGDNGVFNVFAVWNSDITDYDNDPDVDEDYYEVGMEGSFTLSDTFGMTIGYKKVIELDDFDADQVYLGSTWKF
ncbi:MAG: hypothetical protein U9R29_10460 [Thermodesulfobacteriota bacterium]|nr:hypothetical protein [Thermodesulfobacteriota bacterium]